MILQLKKVDIGIICHEMLNSGFWKRMTQTVGWLVDLKSTQLAWLFATVDIR